MPRTYVIDGARFRTLEEFYDEISRVLLPDVYWGKNLNAFNDILMGGFGTPEEGFVLRWQNSQISRQRLGHPETARQLRLRLQSCHPTYREAVQNALARAQQGRGCTVFEWLVEIIESQGGIELQLT